MMLKFRTPIVLLLATVALLCCATSVMAQRRVPQNRPYIDNRRFHYGFCLGMHTQDLKLENKYEIIDPTIGERWYAEQDNFSFGFTVGVVGEMRLNKYFALRTTPTLHLGQRNVKFHEQITGRDSTQTLKSTYISVPIDIKFSGQRHNNFRPYLLAGIAPMVDLTARKRQALRTNPFDCMIEVGMGCDIYLPYFKLIPELKFCFGLTDILNKKRDDLIDLTLTKYTSGLESASTNLIVLTLYFE